eukprot:TRINITY_DN17079_c0_g1_i1.p1 TRINITY_DN17079_c0_g1~~TRINITY_DN17079_c0_g1_i1.p1  ORF type:complete len:133 (-),score=43.75 TRINITY_DN17079_c0_g1_i1:69-467(-)
MYSCFFIIILMLLSYCFLCLFTYYCLTFFFFQAEDGIRDAQESRGLGDVYKRQEKDRQLKAAAISVPAELGAEFQHTREALARKEEELQHAREALARKEEEACLLYTSDAADEEDSVDLGGRRIIKKKKRNE